MDEKKYLFIFPIQFNSIVSFKQSYLRLKERKNVIKIKTNELLLLLLLLIITKIGTKMEQRERKREKKP